MTSIIQLRDRRTLEVTPTHALSDEQIFRLLTERMKRDFAANWWSAREGKRLQPVGGRS
ncbi:hypothetical protein [Alsobacter sp. SYSU BS001988]